MTKTFVKSAKFVGEYSNVIIPAYHQISTPTTLR
jgi:hypothetical protein